jgi:esterase/lipase
MQIGLTGKSDRLAMAVPPLLRPPAAEPAPRFRLHVDPNAPDSWRKHGRIALSWTVPILLALVLAFVAQPAAAFQRVGIVLLHGKTGSPAQFAEMANTLEETGYGVETPEMCWSARRIYDAPLSECFADIDAAAERLRADGIEAIVVGGHSLGGLVALAYGASHDGLAGIVALAPDGEPADFNGHARVGASVAEAAKLMQAGKGDDTATFTDRVLGRDFTIHATPRAFLSFLGPDSDLRPARLLPRLRAPIFWAAGRKDTSQSNAAALFRKAPANGLNTFLTVNAGHMGAPGAALVPMIDWLDRIAGQ